MGKLALRQRNCKMASQSCVALRSLRLLPRGSKAGFAGKSVARPRRRCANARRSVCLRGTTSSTITTSQCVTETRTQVRDTLSCSHVRRTSDTCFASGAWCSVAPRAAAAAGDSSGATPQPLAWPSLRPTGAPDANKHFDVSGVVVAPSFRASSSFTGAHCEAQASSACNCRERAHVHSHHDATQARADAPRRPFLRVLGAYHRGRLAFCRRAAAQAQVAARGSEVGPVRVLFLSEGNVCRSVLAEALFNAQLAARGLDGAVLCESKGAIMRGPPS